ncbi:hypothetical protein FHL15_009216 [Xylaria flabelliformis]|uniref:Clr5 domain-containing protein n=1 Tax=Xylaria flabelliformis TaxID=2512241 RepID=A0A553HPR1_9PEZI|nr:hypothetical protein FHL15_009216 [Xylaria flabelliformis]
MAHAESVGPPVMRMRVAQRNQWSSGYDAVDTSKKGQLITQADFRTILCQLRSDLVETALPALHPTCEACLSLPDSATADRRLVSAISDCIDDALGRWVSAPEVNSSAPEASSWGFRGPSLEQSMYDHVNSQAHGGGVASASSSGTRIEHSNVPQHLQNIFEILNREPNRKPPTSANLTSSGLRNVLPKDSSNPEGQQTSRKPLPEAKKLDWEGQKANIHHLHIERKMTVPRVQKKMAEEYGFVAT